MSEKQDLRSVLLDRRNGLPPGEAASAGRAIAELMARRPEYPSAQRVMLYVAFRGEVDTYPIAGRLISDGKVVCLPRTDVSGQTITPAFWDGRQASLVRGAYGILEPSAEVEVFSPLEIDMVLVPALAFDRSGYRLGYGGGYYDRFLPRCRPDALTAGVGFDWQVLDSVPHEPHDIPLKALITPSGWRVAECPAG